MMGMQWSARYIVGLSYIDELIPPSQRENLIFANFLFSASTNLIIPMVFWLFTKNWWYINALGLIQISISILVVPWYVPESPKFHYENNRFDKARESLNTIAYYNNIQLDGKILFDRESPGG